MKSPIAIIFPLIVMTVLNGCSAEKPATETPKGNPQANLPFIGAGIAKNLDAKNLKENYTTKLRIETLDTEAAMIGHVSCYDASGQNVWNYDTEKFYTGQLENIQEIGFTSYGYLILVDGNIICLATEGNDAGKEKWNNKLFGGVSASWDFDDNENLYICGYLGPELAIINPEGETTAFYEPELLTNFFWPSKLDYSNGFVYITYDSNNFTLKIDPQTGLVDSISVRTESDMQAALCGTWVDNIADPYIFFGFDADGTLVAFRDTEESCHVYTGIWECNDKSFTIPFDQTSDPLVKGLESLGDYEVNGFKSENGVISMDIIQLNNGDSLFSLASNNFNPTMYKISATVNYENPAMRNLNTEQYDI